MSYGFKEFAVKVLTAVNRPLGSMEIGTEGQRLGLDKDLATQGKTPWYSIGAQIYLEIKNNPTPRFQQVSKRPALFALAEQNFSKKDIADTVEHNETGSEPHYNERCLHPVLVKYLYSNAHFQCLTKTIYHENSQKKSKNADKWVHPDLIGVYRDLHVQALSPQSHGGGVDSWYVSGSLGRGGGRVLPRAEHDEKQGDQNHCQPKKNRRVDQFLHPQNHDFCFSAHIGTSGFYLLQSITANRHLCPISLFPKENIGPREDLTAVA